MPLLLLLPPREGKERVLCDYHQVVGEKSIWASFKSITIQKSIRVRRGHIFHRLEESLVKIRFNSSSFGRVLSVFYPLVKCHHGALLDFDFVVLSKDYVAISPKGRALATFRPKFSSELLLLFQCLACIYWPSEDSPGSGILSQRPPVSTWNFAENRRDVLREETPVFLQVSTVRHHNQVRPFLQPCYVYHIDVYVGMIQEWLYNQRKTNLWTVRRQLKALHLFRTVTDSLKTIEAQEISVARCW